MTLRDRAYQILIVEDSPTQALELQLLLESEGYDVTVARDGIEGHAAATNGAFDLVLSDLNMPRMDGFELCRRLKADPRTRSLPFLIITDRHRLTDMIGALEVGADNFVTKPYHPAELRQQISRLLEDISVWRGRRSLQSSNLVQSPEEFILRFERAQIMDLLMASAVQLDEELQTVAETCRMLTLEKSVEEVRDYVVERTAALTGADCAVMAVWNRAGADPFIRAHAADQRIVRAVEVAMSDATTWLNEELARDARPRLELGLAEIPPFAGLSQDCGLVSCVASGLATHGRLLGAMVCFYRAERPPTPDGRRRLYNLASLTEVALENRESLHRYELQTAALEAEAVQRRQAEAELRQLVESAPLAIMSLAVDGLVQSWNPAAEALFGWTAEEVLGKPYPIIPPADMAFYQERRRRVMAGATLQNQELRRQRKDGSLVDVLASVAPKASPAEGPFAGTVVIMADITERKRAEAELQRLVQSSPVAIVGLTANRNVMSWNPAAEKLFGWTAEEVIGKPYPLVPPDGVESFRERQRRTDAGETMQNQELRRRRKDGSLLDVLVATAPRFGADGKTPDGLVAILADDSERKRAVAELQDTNERLAAALSELQAIQSKVIQQERLRALGQMASGIAHDLNNALSPVLGFCELLLKVPANLEDPAKVRRYVELINTGATDAASVVHGLSEFYRQREPLDRLQLTDLAGLVDQVVALTEPKWKSQPHAQGVEIAVQARVTDVPSIMCNASALREALTNLVLNAVDAMPNGGRITIVGRVVRDRALIEVSDTGGGMPKEVQSRCFEPFFTTKGTQGTGLGLAMVYGIVQRHHGTIEVESIEGRGTSFVISLPLHGENAVDAEAVPAGPAPSLRILLTDDEPLVLEYLRESLALDGHVVTLAGNGIEALEKFQAGPYDLIITDLAMPGMNGEQLTAAIKAVSPNTPVILLSGFGDLMQAKGERPDGVAVVLGKPVNSATLRGAIIAALRATGKLPS